jgi:hypothetical protein
LTARAAWTSPAADSVTEFFADGSYRVTRCEDGEPVRATTMARIVTPTRAEPYVPVAIETAGTRVFLLYGDPSEPRWARRSVVDFGRLTGLCGNAVTLACTSTFNRPISESDQRYNSAFRWSTTGRAGTYDIESAAAHETGHSIGLGHVRSSAFPTMYPQICAGCTRARTLARGDVRGMRAIYR